MRSASDLWGYRHFSVAIDKTVFLAVQCAYAQAVNTTDITLFNLSVV